MNRELITYTNPKSPVSEMFKTLRTNIQFMNTDKQLKTLLVSSTLPGEGKSWTAANLAVTFAQAGKKVLVVDADMRKGRQFNIFGVSPTPGLSNYLSGVADSNIDNYTIDDFIQKTEVENLCVLTAGNVPPNPSELLVSEKMIELNNAVKKRFDITIFDGTPSLIVTDAPILARIVDSTILVTAHNETKIDNVAKVKKSIENIGGKVAGVVVNKIPTSAKKYENTYYYGSNMPALSKGKKKKNSSGFLWNNSKKNTNEKTTNDSSFVPWKSSKSETDVEKEIMEKWNKIEEETWNNTATDTTTSNEWNSTTTDTTTTNTDNWTEKNETTEKWANVAKNITSANDWDSSNTNTNTSNEWNNITKTITNDWQNDTTNINETSDWNNTTTETTNTGDWNNVSTDTTNTSDWTNTSTDTTNTSDWNNVSTESTNTSDWSNTTVETKTESNWDTTTEETTSTNSWDSMNTDSSNEWDTSTFAEPILSWEQDNNNESNNSEIYKSFDNISSSLNENNSFNFNDTTNNVTTESSIENTNQNFDVLENTQDVIEQINKYLEEERNKLKNGDLND